MNCNLFRLKRKNTVDEATISHRDPRTASPTLLLIGIKVDWLVNKQNTYHTSAAYKIYSHLGRYSRLRRVWKKIKERKLRLQVQFNPEDQVINSGMLDDRVSLDF